VTASRGGGSDQGVGETGLYVAFYALRSLRSAWDDATVSTFGHWPRSTCGRRSAKSIPLDKLSAIPDCGFFPVPRWVAAEKLKRLVAGTELAHTRLG
jgi:hypothetical protein